MVRIVYADGPSAPRCPPSVVLEAAALDADPRRAHVLLGWTPEPLPWIDDPDFRADTVLPGYGLSRAVRDGRVTPLPVRLSGVSTLLHDRPPHVAVVPGVRRGDDYAFAGSVGWGDVAAAVAQRVVVEVDETAPDLGAPMIPGHIVATVRRDDPQPPVSLREPDDIDRRIAAHVVELLPHDATVQFGLGAVPDAIAASIDRPVRIWSGLVTDAMAGLHARGLLAAPAVAVHLGWRSDRTVAPRCDAVPAVDDRDPRRRHDGGIERLVAINAAPRSVSTDRSTSNAPAVARSPASAATPTSVPEPPTPRRHLDRRARSTDRHGNPTIVDHVEVVSTPLRRRRRGHRTRCRRPARVGDAERPPPHRDRRLSRAPLPPQTGMMRRRWCQRHSGHASTT
ncbi:MAG: hypothetical protein R2697_21095 [Ilumatobacteraceae bacterium]